MGLVPPQPNLPLSAPLARVSLEKQAKNGYSLETQIRLMSEINARYGFATSEEYVLQDDGYEGDDWDRPAINQGVELIRQGKVKALTFMETDRFSRDVQGGLALIKKVQALGGFVILGDLGVVHDEANFRLMLHVKLALSEFQKANTKNKSREAVITKIQRGEIQGGRAPYGYTYLPKREGSKLVINPEQAKIVRKIFNWYDKGWSFREIVRQLVADGVPAPGRPRKDGVMPKWNASFLSMMVKNETYIGLWHYNKRSAHEPTVIRSSKPRHRKRSSHKLRDRKDWLPVTVDPIIDPALFDRCRRRASANPNNLGGRPSDRYLLKGLLWCPYGHHMCGAHRERRGGAEFRYVCSHRDRVTGELLCKALSYRAEPLEEFVWSTTIEVLSDEAVLRKIIAEHDQKTGAGKKGDRAKLEQRIAELFQTEMRFRADSGRVTGSKAQEIRDHYAKLITETQDQREILERQLATLVTVGERVDIGALARAVRLGAKEANRTERQKLLQRWVSRVEYHNGEVNIDLMIPLSSKSAQNCGGELTHPNSFAHITITRRLAA